MGTQRGDVKQGINVKDKKKATQKCVAFFQIQNEPPQGSNRAGRYFIRSICRARLIARLSRR